MEQGRLDNRVSDPNVELNRAGKLSREQRQHLLGLPRPRIWRYVVGIGTGIGAAFMALGAVLEFPLLFAGALMGGGGMIFGLFGWLRVDLRVYHVEGRAECWQRREYGKIIRYLRIGSVKFALSDANADEVCQSVIEHDVYRVHFAVHYGDRILLSFEHLGEV